MAASKAGTCNTIPALSIDGEGAGAATNSWAIVPEVAKAIRTIIAMVKAVASLTLPILLSVFCVLREIGSMVCMSGK